VSQTLRLAGAAAELAASMMSAKDADLLKSHLFQPIAVETSSSTDSSTATFPTDLGHKISSVSGAVQEAFFLFQRISVSAQCFKSSFSMIVLLHLTVSRISHSSALLLACFN